jgi:starch synthase
MIVLSVASELYPLVKTGGLADVAGALPAALAGQDVGVVSLVPGYPAVLTALAAAEVVHHFADLMGAPARLLRGTAHGLDIVALDAPHLFNRTGNPYLGPDGRDWPDNAQRFAAFALAAAQVARGLIPGFQPDVVHAHDWQAALTAAHLHYGGGPRALVTIHNLAFQGQFAASLFPLLGLPPQAFAVDGVEYYGGVGFLKGGLATASAISTVSPSYALEILGPREGMGLDGLLRAREGVLHGVLNGIDTAVWNPERDPHIVQGYSARTLGKRAANRDAVEQRFGLTPGTGLLVAVVSRFTAQKGIDLLAAAIPALVNEGVSFALLGSGDPGLEQALGREAAAYPGRVGLITGYDEALSHLMQAGADAILVPSRFEPCGLTQLYGLRYGALPIVARVGGLADTVIDANEAAMAAGVATGFQHAPESTDALIHAVRRAAMLQRQTPRWQALQRNAMASDVSWARSAARYAEIYSSLNKA